MPPAAHSRGARMTPEHINQTSSIDLASHIRTLGVIPAHNEERFIGSVVLQTRRYVDAVIVVDDGSDDHTATVADAAGAIVLRHQGILGKSSALNTALRLVRALPAQAVVVLDGDGQHYPEDIPGLVGPILDGKADIVVGSRFLRNGNGNGNHIPRWRVLGQHSLTVFTNLLSGASLSDSQSGFRALSRRAVMELGFSQSGFVAESEMQFLAREHGLKVAEVPIEVTYAEGPKRNPLSHGVEVVDGILELAGQTRPLLFFGVPGTALLVAGAGLGWQIVAIYEATQVLAVGYGLITVLITMVGALSLFVGIVLHSVRGLLMQLKAAPPR